MKALKILLVSAIFLTSFAAINTNSAFAEKSVCADLRVRVVPGCPDQKKKDAKRLTPPKPTPTAKSGSGFFCNETSVVKSKLAIANGGTPK